MMFEASGRFAMRRALADARARRLAPLISEIREGGAASLEDIARALNARGITAHQGGLWTGKQVERLLTRLKTL